MKQRFKTWGDWVDDSTENIPDVSVLTASETTAVVKSMSAPKGGRNGDELALCTEGGSSDKQRPTTVCCKQPRLAVAKSITQIELSPPPPGGKSPGLAAAAASFKDPGEEFLWDEVWSSVEGPPVCEQPGAPAASTSRRAKSSVGSKKRTCPGAAGPSSKSTRK